MIFVSSTSVLDTDYYLGTPEGETISEDLPLSRSAKGLPTGYGQSKWVCEALMRDAGNRGLCGVIVRPGYVTGESKLGTTITDDFLVSLRILDKFKHTMTNTNHAGSYAQGLYTARNLSRNRLKQLY
jgi:thioester reductase-like protein